MLGRMSKARISVNGFISSAEKNRELAGEFIDLLNERVTPLNEYDIDAWTYLRLEVGICWDEKIKEKCDDAAFGIFLLSPAFLGRRQCLEELEFFLGSDRLAFPVGLAPVNLQLHDLRGLEKLQIHRLRNDRGDDPRWFSQLSEGERGELVDGLVTSMVKRFRAEL